MSLLQFTSNACLNHRARLICPWYLCISRFIISTDFITDLKSIQFVEHVAPHNASLNPFPYILWTSSSRVYDEGNIYEPCQGTPQRCISRHVKQQTKYNSSLYISNHSQQKWQCWKPKGVNVYLMLITHEGPAVVFNGSNNNTPKNQLQESLVSTSTIAYAIGNLSSFLSTPRAHKSWPPNWHPSIHILGRQCLNPALHVERQT